MSALAPLIKALNALATGFDEQAKEAKRAAGEAGQIAPELMVVAFTLSCQRDAILKARDILQAEQDRAYGLGEG